MALLDSNRSRAIVLVALAAAFIACQRGPAEDVLREELQQQLDVAFAPGLFTVRDFRRLGSASFTGSRSAPSGLHVYYNTVLELNRDYALTAWKGLNVGTLSFVVGATDAGVTGIRARGNVAGDTLRVQGRLSYAKEGGSWHRIDAPSPVARETAPTTQERVGIGPKRLLEQIRSSVEGAASRDQSVRGAVIIDELGTALARVDLRLARLDEVLTFGSGPRGGTYHRFGLALSDFAERQEMALHSFESVGSLESGALLRSSLLDFALVQSDVAETLYGGLTESGILPNRKLRSVASLWPEAVHLVTLASSGITRLSDLSGRRVGVGERGSGTRFNVLAVTVAAGVMIDPPPEIVDVGALDGIAALEAGEIEALFVTSAIPSPPLQAFAARNGDVRFVALDAGLVHRLAQERFAYYALEVDARTYPNQSDSFLTLGLAASLVTREDVPDAAVTRLLELLVGQADVLSDSYFRAGFINPETMRLGMAVPLHAAAERFYDNGGDDVGE